MSDRDLEARLSELRPPEPRADLRGEVLAVVRQELAAARPSWFDRLLARRSTWVAAAAVLVALLAASVILDDTRERRLDELTAHSATVRPNVSPGLAWRSREALLACLLRGERCDG